MNRIIGVAWKKQSKDGKNYLSGILRDLGGDINIAIFPNDRKDKDTQPDYNIVLSGNKPDDGSYPQANNVDNDEVGF